MADCFVENKDLTDDIYDGMAAYEKGDMDTGLAKFYDANDKYATALAKCGADVTDPAKKWGDTWNDLTHRIGWTELEQKIYNDHKKEMDDNIELEFQWWDKGVAFNAGMFAGRNSKIFIDNSNNTPTYFHPFF